MLGWRDGVGMMAGASVDWLQPRRVNIATPNEAGVTVCVGLPNGFNKYPPDKSHITSLVLGYLTSGNHALKNLFFPRHRQCISGFPAA